LKSFTLSDEQVAQGHECDLVFRFIFQDLLVFGDGLRKFPLLEILLRRVEVLGLVISHLQMLFTRVWALLGAQVIYWALRAVTIARHLAGRASVTWRPP